MAWYKNGKRLLQPDTAGSHFRKRELLGEIAKLKERVIAIDNWCIKVEEDYKKHPTGCGSSFGEILCYELHENGLTFKQLAKKWKMDVSFLGELIAYHCKKIE